MPQPASRHRYACSSCERVKDSASLILRDFVDDFTSTTQVRESACLNPRQDVERLHSRMRGCDSPRDPTRVGALRCFMSSGLVNPRVTTLVVIISTRPNFTLHLLFNHNASKHLQSLYEVLHYLIKTYECNMDSKDAKFLIYMINMCKLEN